MGSRWRQRVRTLCAVLLLPIAASYALPALALLGDLDGVLACCRTQQHCCCRRPAHTGHGGPAWTAVPGCQRRCGFLTSSLSGSLASPAVARFTMAQPVTQLAALPSTSRTPAQFTCFLYQRPPPADQPA